MKNLSTLILTAMILVTSQTAQADTPNVQNLIDLAQINCGIILQEQLNLTVASNGQYGLKGEYFTNPQKAYNECVLESVNEIYSIYGIKE